MDYSVEVRGLNEKDRILPFGDLGDFSLTGVEIIFTRHKLKYMYMYYFLKKQYELVPVQLYVCIPKSCVEGGSPPNVLF